jgi:hypothetical protein
MCLNVTEESDLVWEKNQQNCIEEHYQIRD